MRHAGELFKIEGFVMSVNGCDDGGMRGVLREYDGQSRID